jgi:hypothetical protein
LAAAVAIGGSALLTAPTPASAAGSVGSPTLTLIGQTQTVTPPAPGDPAPFAIQVEIDGAPVAGARLGLTFYEKVGTRSAFEQTLTSPPSGIPLQTVTPVAVGGLKALRTGGVELDTTVVADTPESSGSNTVDLSDRQNCGVGSGRCSGVYPVLVQLFDQSGSVVSHLTTYLTYTEQKSPKPLVFSWVVPMGAPVQIRSGGGLSGALSPVSPARVRNLAQLGRLLAENQYSSLRESIAASPATVQRLGSGASQSAPAAILSIGVLAASGADSHQLIAEPYVPVNLGALSAAGVTTDILGQMTAGAAVMNPLLRGLPASDQPSSSTWVAGGSVNPAIVTGLRVVRADHLVLPDTDLPPATELAHATWSQPFSLSVGRGQDVTAAVSDSQLSSYFAADPHDPALGATQLLADLAIIHYELPGASDPTRGVIAVPPADWNPAPLFVSTLLGGLLNNPVVTTATLTGFFNSVPAGGNQAETGRRLAANQNGQQIDATQAAAIVAGRQQISGFDNALGGNSAVGTALDDLLLASESSDLTPVAQRIGLATFQRQLAAELGNIQVVSNTVTLTARTASIPITIVSSLGYHLHAHVKLSSAKLAFPAGSTRTVFIDHPTNSTQFEVRALTSGDLPLTFTLTSPNGELLIAKGELTVRSTATSIVGIVLTLVAAVVLGGWWARTWARSRRLRRERPSRGGAR